MKPVVSERNFTPSACGLESLLERTVGTAVEGQIVASVTVELVVNDQLLVVMVFPAWSFAALRVTVYVVEGFRAPVGVKVMVLVEGLYAEDPGTLPTESATTKLIVAGWTDSLNVAVMMG